MASSSIDRSTVDLNRGEMSFGLFDYSPRVEAILLKDEPSLTKLDRLASALGEAAFPGYLKRYILRTAVGGKAPAVFVHPPTDISGYADADGLDKAKIIRRRGFIGAPQLGKAPNSTVHHLLVFHNGGKKARLFYKLLGSIQFIKNTSRDT